MTKRTVFSAQGFQALLGELRTAFAEHGRLTVSWNADLRSLDQNAISHAWYEQLARELPEDDARGWKRMCKLHFGVPILRAEDEHFREFYDGALKSLTYEQKLAAMEYVPVTSIMSKAQLSRYLEDMRESFASQRSVYLEFPVEIVKDAPPPAR